MKRQTYKNRQEAGRMLAEKILPLNVKNPLILAIPRGGVPVGFEVAKVLHAPLDTLVVRKIGAPFDPELGLGAIAPGDVIVFDNKSLELLGLTARNLDPIIAKELQEMDRRIVHYRSGEYSADAPADTVVVIDDGLATGVSARAAIESALIQQKPARLIFAAPICSREAVEKLSQTTEVVCGRSVDDLGAIGEWYDDFNQVSDDEVVSLLNEAATHNI